jgi:hypothetical protein
MDSDLRLPVPPEFHVLLLRTDFADEPAYEQICDLVAASDCEGYSPTVIRINDSRYAGMGPDDVYRACADPDIGYVFIVDTVAITDPEHPLLVLDIGYDDDAPGRNFRALPARVCNIDANLGISNMEFFEFADAVDTDGVFRGF